MTRHRHLWAEREPWGGDQRLDQAAQGAAGIPPLPPLRQDGAAEAHRHSRRTQHRAHSPGPGVWQGRVLLRWGDACSC
jgi:hypothetical protein